MDTNKLSIEDYIALFSNNLRSKDDITKMLTESSKDELIEFIIKDAGIEESDEGGNDDERLPY